MRLWSIHPKYLDRIGLLALWRESLLAQKVLDNQTKGYRNHPQLIRFKKTDNPLDYINIYLMEIWLEAQKRGYAFNKNKISVITPQYSQISISSGQINYEIGHLKNKLQNRDPIYYQKITNEKNYSAHPLFIITKGAIADWEKIR